MTSKHYSLWLQAIVLIVCLGLSLLAFHLVDRRVYHKSLESLGNLADQDFVSVDRRFENYGDTLDGVAGLFMASDEVTASDMFFYGDALDVANNQSGIDAVGFAASRRGDAAQSNSLLSLNATGAEDVRGPAVTATERFVVEYLEPQAKSEALLGLDFVTLPSLLAVAQTSRARRETLLVMNLGYSTAQIAEHQAVLLKPIFKSLLKAETSSEDQDDFLGFAFAIIDLNIAFNGRATAQDRPIEIHISEAHSDIQELVDANGLSSQARHPPTDYLVEKKFDKFGRNLTLTWLGTPRFERLQPFRVKWIALFSVLLVGALISSILNILIRRGRAIAAIVAQKTLEIETRDKEQSSILENSMLAIISAKPSGEIVHLNEVARQLLSIPENPGLTPNLMLDGLLPNLDLQRADGRFKLHVPSNVVNHEPSIIEIEKNTWWITDTDMRFTLVLRDISVSERYVEEIAKTEQRWNLALMGAQIGVFDIDLVKQTSVVSKTWYEMMRIGFLPDCTHPYSKQLDKIHPDDRAYLNDAEHACIEGRTDRVEAQFRVEVMDGEWRWIQTDAVVVERAPTGIALRMLGTQLDVTEKIKLEQIKRDFVATVSHELRTPLTSIKGALGLLKLSIKDPNPVAAERLIQIALSNSDRLVSLVNDILDMEKISSGSMTHFAKAENLGEIMNIASEQIAPYALQWRVGFEVVLPDNEQHIWVDEKRVSQVLANLLSNACKFADADTTVRLVAKILPSYAHISVSNLGLGIPDDFRGKVFQPFSQADSSDTRQRGGTGLGLNISRKMIEAMGGTIGFESEPGQETVFWFTCPLVNSTGDGPII